MKETLELLTAFANQGDNIWFKHKLEVLKIEIDIALIDAKTEVYNEFEEKIK
jgi:hypothetical protein